YGWCLHVGTEQAGPGQVYRLAGSLLQYSEDCGVRRVGLAGRCLAGRFRWGGGCHRGSPPRGYPACMDDGDADIGGGDAAAWLLPHAHAAIVRCGRIRRQVGKRDVGAVGGGNQGFLLEEAHLVLYSVHYPLSPCRGFCHEDCPSFLEGGAFGRWLGTE